MGTHLFHLGKHRNATFGSYKVSSLLFAVEISCIQIRSGFLTYLMMAILLFPRYTLYTPPPSTFHKTVVQPPYLGPVWRQKAALDLTIMG